MKQQILSTEDILAGYQAVSQLYPYIPPMCLWRSWEYAAYRHYALPEPVLDVGCGDGGFFRLVWPQVRNVIGIDIDTNVVNIARQSEVYQQVCQAAAHRVPVATASFASAFANCSLEHMDYLPDVLGGIYHSLRPGGLFLSSVVTDKFLEWATLPLLAEYIANPQLAQRLQVEYKAYHHLVNYFSPGAWIELLTQAGFEVLEYIPIVPEMTSRLFLFLDHLWHVQMPDGELGSALHRYLMTVPNLPHSVHHWLIGCLQSEQDWSTGSGAVFLARRS